VPTTVTLYLPPEISRWSKDMHKTDLVTAVSAQTGLNKDKADAVVSAFVEQITNALSRDETIALTGFGSFTISRRAARTGRHPQTGAPLAIAASKSVVFKAGKILKAAVN
jgi:nucleoid DNA-binding protein